jgi:hypothetical protein
MKKFINAIKGIRITTQESINKIVDDSLTRFKNYYPIDKTGLDLFSEEYANYVFGQNEEARTKFLSAVNKIKNPQLRDIINSSFDYFPEENMSFEELKLTQSAIRSKYNTDPIWQGCVDSFGDYVIGSGVTVSTPVTEINFVLTDFRKRNKFGIRERNMVKDLFMDGEYFFLLFEDNLGNIFVRKGDPKGVVEIETDPFDIEAKFSYKREIGEIGENGQLIGTLKTQRILDINYKKYQNTQLGYKQSKFLNEQGFKSNVVCKHIKLSEEDQLRGRPPARGILKFLKIYENFILDRMVLNHERSKVVWIKEIRGRNVEDLNKPTLAPKGGIMLIESESVKYRTESSKLEATEAKEDALHVLYYIGSGIRYPLHVLNQRTDQQVYSSIRKADTPFSTMISGFQTFLSYEMEEIYRYQILKKVESKELKPKYKFPSYSEDSILNAAIKEEEMRMNGATKKQIFNELEKVLKEGLTEIEKPTEEIPINQEFPQIVLQDPKENAEVLEIHDKMGIASKLTLSSKAGYDGKKELARRIQESKIEGLNPMKKEDKESFKKENKKENKKEEESTK